MSVIDLFRPTPPTGDEDQEALIKKQYKYWRIRIFYSMYIGYVFYYFTRKSFTFAMPIMMQTLGYDKAQLGILGSVLSISYGMSKFFSGIMSDRVNPRFFMASGLILTGIFNIFFGLSSSIGFFVLFWGLNGWFQGWGWPPCAKLLTHWYSQNERGRWWGACSTSHNVGGALIPLVAAFAAQSYGWRYAMYLPGVICIVVGLFLLNRLRGTPESLGLPTVERFRNDYTSKKELVDEKISTKQQLFDFVLKNKFIWILACSYFFVYVVRTAVNDWGQLFLIETRRFTLVQAGLCVFWFELGGFCGTLSAGWASDKVFAGRRGPINVLFLIGVIAALFGFWFLPADSGTLASIMMFIVGFMIFGPQMLIGMAAAELSHKKAAGTANGFVGWFAYLGAAFAGWPIGKITDAYGWSAFFAVLGLSCVLSLALLIPLWNVRSRPAVDEEGDD